jgi:uncharacterized metal-binding protein YceD (DUF177 family)
MAMRTVSSLKSRKPAAGKARSGGSYSGGAGPKLDEGCFTHPLGVDTVPETGLDINVRASETECAALAADCGLAAVHEFEAAFLVRKEDTKRFKVTGNLNARVTQICGVSLDPFETHVRAAIDVDFASGRDSFGPVGGAVAAALHGDDPPDPIIDGMIDLGALAVEFLILNLDVYPRKPGVSFEAAEVSGESLQKNSPFSVLRRRS